MLNCDIGLDTYGAGLREIWMIDAVKVEPRGRDFTPCTSAVCNQLPQLLWIANVAREPTAHADNGDGHVRIHGGYWYVEVFDLSPLAAIDKILESVLDL